MLLIFFSIGTIKSKFQRHEHGYINDGEKLRFLDINHPSYEKAKDVILRRYNELCKKYPYFEAKDDGHFLKESLPMLVDFFKINLIIHSTSKGVDEIVAMYPKTFQLNNCFVHLHQEIDTAQEIPGHMSIIEHFHKFSYGSTIDNNGEKKKVLPYGRQCYFCKKIIYGNDHSHNCKLKPNKCESCLRYQIPSDIKLDKKQYKELNISLRVCDSLDPKKN